MKRKLMMFLTLFAIGIGFMTAQTTQVHGTVVDDKGEPIIGATIQVKGLSGRGTITDNFGKFTISAPSDGALIVSYVGMETLEVAVSPKIRIRLTSDTSLLDEVVVTALGIKRQKRDLGYSTVKVDSKELTQAKSVSVATSLQGKVAGLNVSSLNSGVLDEVKINMRGIRSLTGNNNPMLLLDGVPVALSYLSSINPNDVENVDVLKGTSAAAIYGPDARNGVIVVSTKSGTEGRKPTITFSSSVQLSSISFFPKFQTQFGSGSNGDFIPYENESWGPAYDGKTVPLGKPLEDGSQQEVVYSPIKNNRKDFFNTGLTVQTDLSFAAKDFYFSFQDANVKGILPNDKNRRTGIRMNASKEYGKFKISFNTNYIQRNHDIYDSDAMNDFYSSKNLGMHAGVMDLVFATQAHVPLTSYKDFRNNKWATYDNYYCEYSQNPYFVIDNWREKGLRHQLLSNVDLSLAITDWLDLKYRAALTYSSYNKKSFTKQVIPSSWAENTRNFHFIPQGTSESISMESRLSSEPYLNLHKKFDNFSLNGILGSYLRENRYKRLQVGASPLAIENLFNISGRTGEPSANQREELVRMFSIYGSFSLGYKNFATIEFTGRNDKTSLLSLENNSFFYPGVNASFVLTDAIPALQSDVFNFFKLRASWNKTGNVDIYPYLLDPVYVQNADRIETGFPYDGLPGYFAGNSLTDPNLKPEFINSVEVGFETSFLKNRFTLDATYYNQKNTDQIISIRTPRPTGYSFARVNAASFRNYGYEISLKGNPLIKVNDLNVNLGINYSYNNSEILNLNGDNKQFVVGGYFMASTTAVVGKPAFVISAKDYQRDPQGRVIVDKKTGIPQIDETNKLFGRTMPLHTLGLAPSITWKGLTISSLFEYKGGHYTFNYQGTTMAWDGTSTITASNNRERFIFPNSVYKEGDNYIPNENITINSNFEFFHGDNYRSIATNMLFSASAWRWRELTISYSLPKKWLNFQDAVQGVDIALTGRNLILWLPKTNEWSDPDFSVYNDNVGSIVTSAINPPIRTFGGNLTVKF